MSTTHYETSSAARDHFKDLLDQAVSGTTVTVRRDSFTAVVLDVGRLRHFIASVVPPCAEVIAEAEGWSAFIPRLPVAGAGATFDEAVGDLAGALREYADDWPRLQYAPNHREHWGLVQLVNLSSDEELLSWISGSER